MKAFVAGATGETGRRIVAELLDRNIPVRALVRDLAAARSILPSQVELVTGDVLQPDTLRSAMGDCTVVLCATGAKPSLDPLVLTGWIWKGRKTWWMSPRKKASSILCW